MLVKTSRFPGWGKQKPAQWGPFSAVQDAVRHNAERLGVDPAWLIPMWEASGPVARDVFAGGEATLSGLSWDASEQSLTGFTYTGTQALVLPSTDLYRLAGQENITVIVSVYLGAWGLEYPHIWSTRNTSTTVSIFGVGADQSYNTPSDYRRPYITQGTTNYGISAVNVVPENAKSTLAFALRSGNVAFYKDGELVGSASGAGAFSTTTITPLIGNRVGGGRGLPSGQVYYAYAFHNECSATQIAQFHETPYALIMRVPRTVFFDLGAGGLSAFVAACASSLSSSDISTSVLRELSASVAGSLSSADLQASILRPLAVTVPGELSSSDSVVNLLRAISASAPGQIASSDVSASVLRDMASNCTGELSSSDIVASIVRQLAATASGSLSSSDISVLTTAVKLFAAACSAELSSSDIQASINRILGATCPGSLSSSDISVTLAGVLLFLANCQAQLSSSDITPAILRTLSAHPAASITSSDAVLSGLFTLVADCQGEVVSDDILVAVLRTLSVACASSLTSIDIQAAVTRVFAAAPSGSLSSSDILVLLELFYPELFDAYSRITLTLDGYSRITTTLEGYSRIDRSA
jgi:hypothetical protein